MKALRERDGSEVLPSDLISAYNISEACYIVLECISEAEGHSKRYVMQVSEPSFCEYIAWYGRIGAAPKSKVYGGFDEISGRAQAMYKMYLSKLAKGYKLVGYQFWDEPLQGSISGVTQGGEQ